MYFCKFCTLLIFSNKIIIYGFHILTCCLLDEVNPGNYSKLNKPLAYLQNG